MQKNYVQEILNIIHGNIPQAELAEKLSDYHEKDLADALEALMPAERKSLYPILGVDEMAEIFAYLDDAEPYLKELSRDEAAKVISNMDSDDAADALEDLDEIDKGEIVNKLDRDSIEDVKMLLSYSEDEIGSKMTTNYIRIKNDMTIRQAMSELVKQAGENDNISVLYVVDENEHFYGAIAFDYCTCRRSSCGTHRWVLPLRYRSGKNQRLYRAHCGLCGAQSAGAE